MLLPRSQRAGGSRTRIPTGSFHVAIPLCRREILFQLLRVPARTVARRVSLDTPPFFERTGVNGVEAELIEELCDRGLGVRDHLRQ